MKPLLMLGGFAAGATAMVLIAVLPRAGPARAPAPQQLVLVLQSHRVHQPYNLAVRPYQPVRLTIVNPTRETHTFTVPALGISQIVLPALAGKPTRTVVTFTAPYGPIDWHCEPCHEQMNGTIYAVITPRSPDGLPPGGFHW